MVTVEAPAPQRSAYRGAVALKVLLAVAMAFVLVFGVGYRLIGHGSGLDVTHEMVMWPHEPVMNISATPNQAFLDAHRDDARPYDNAFPWTDTSNGTVDSATGKPPVEYALIGNQRMFLWGPTFLDRLYYAGPPLVGDVIVLIVLMLLWRIVGTLRTQVFSSVNARRMVVIGVLIGVGLSLTRVLVHFGQVGIVARSAAAGRLSVPFSFSFVPLLAGAVIVVFAEVFRRGIAMREDLETLV